MMNIYIKNMVCVRCKMAVQDVLTKLKIEYLSIELGRVILKEELNGEQQIELNTLLKHFELELMEDRRKILVERIKNIINNLLQSDATDFQLKLSFVLSEQLHYSYTYLANIFSEMEGITIEHYYIDKRIERVKELIIYEGLTLTEITYQLNFSSVSHLCLQFKKVTGHTPATFKKLCWTDDFEWRKL